MSPPKKDPLVGKRLREYVILELIGKGGMAKVYKARHSLLDEVRAIKFLRTELRERQECIARFQREAPIMVRLRHKHLVLLHEFGTVGNELFFPLAGRRGPRPPDARETEVGPTRLDGCAVCGIDGAYA